MTGKIMQIDIPKIEQDRLAQNAKAAGYRDVRSYVSEHLLALAWAVKHLGLTTQLDTSVFFQNLSDTPTALNNIAQG